VSRGDPPVEAASTRARSVPVLGARSWAPIGAPGDTEELDTGVSRGPDQKGSMDPVGAPPGGGTFRVWEHPVSAP